MMDPTSPAPTQEAVEDAQRQRDREALEQRLREEKRARREELTGASEDTVASVSVPTRGRQPRSEVKFPAGHRAGDVLKQFKKWLAGRGAAEDWQGQVREILTRVNDMRYKKTSKAPHSANVAPFASVGRWGM